MRLNLLGNYAESALSNCDDIGKILRFSTHVDPLTVAAAAPKAEPQSQFAATLC